MNTNQLLLAYPGADCQIKTVYFEAEIFFNITDVVTLLAKQNVQLARGKKADGLTELIAAQIDVLDKDEVKDFDGDGYMTQPGLFRIILRDNSSACKKFQRWVLHDVLPSIQKYGTYPPPLIEQESEVMKMAKTLVVEIEQREKLEKETKEKFNKHEKILRHLSDRLDTISYDSDSTKYISLNEYCGSQGIDPTNKQIIQGWCIKICAEMSEPSKKSVSSGKEEILFPDYVVAKAIQYSRS